MNFIKSLKLSILVLFLLFLVIFSGCGGITTPGIPQDLLSAVITANTTSGEAPLEVIFNASESSAVQGNEIVSYGWDFGDSKTGEGTAVQHGFDSPGSYTVVLTINDNSGAVDTSSIIITVFQPNETVIEQDFNIQNGTEFDTNTGLKIIIPPILIEGQMNLEVKYDSSPSQLASDFINLHSNYSIIITPQKELTTSEMNKDQESMKVSFIFDVPENVDSQSMAIFEWTEEGWCLAGASDIETIEQLGGVLSPDGKHISLEISDFYNYSKNVNSWDSRNILGSIKLSLSNFTSNLMDASICPIESENSPENKDGYIEKKVFFQSLECEVLGYGRGIYYKVGILNNIVNLFDNPNWNQPYVSDLNTILAPDKWYLIPTDDSDKRGVLVLKFGTEGGKCTVWLEADKYMLFKKWLLYIIPYSSIADAAWRNLWDIGEAFIDNIINLFAGYPVDDGILFKEIKEMQFEVIKALAEEGIGNLNALAWAITTGVATGELIAGIRTYIETVYDPKNPCYFKSPGYWEWEITVPPIKNNPPIANAGPDQTVQVGTLINLDGTASYDDDGDTLSYKWTQIKGPEIVNLSDSNFSKPTFMPTKVGIYEFELIVNDGKDDSEPDNVIIKVTESIITKPDPPTPLSPGTTSTPGPTIDSLTPTLQWETVSDADYYNLSISIYPYGTSNIIYNPQQISGSSITIPSGKLQAGKKYRWNMRAHNSAGFSDYSITLYFQTGSITTNKPDLIVNNIWTEPNPPIAAGYTTIGIEIKNQGNVDSTETFFLEFYFDDTYQGHVYINGLTAGSTNTSYWQAVTWPSDTNLHTIKGVVDPDNTIIESNEDNNQYSIQVKATEPPIGIGTLKIESVPGIAKVYIDEVYNGETPSSGYLTISNLAAGDHNLKVIKSGYKYWIGVVTIPSGSIKYKAVILESTTTKPDPPTPLSPGTTSAPGPTIDTLTPILQWQTVSNADYYNLAISEYPYGTTNIIYNPQQISGSPLTVPSGKLEAGKKYRWNMRAHNSAGFSDYSITLYFQTPQTVSASIDSYSPSSKITINTGESFTISTTFTNTGNTSAYFYPGVSIWNSNGSLIFTDWGGKTYLNQGQQKSESWYPTINTPGEYWLQFGIWNEAKSELLDKKPSPSQNLIKVVSLSSQTERLTNGSFSSGTSVWTLVGDFWAGTNLYNYYTSPGYSAGGVDSTGLPKNKAVGWMYQNVTIPSGATSAILNFWYNITSEETGSTAYDVLNVTIKSSTGNYLATVAIVSNLNKSTLGSYKKITFDVTPYKGQTVRIHFLATTDDYLHTVFRIDDVSLMSDG